MSRTRSSPARAGGSDGTGGGPPAEADAAAAAGAGAGNLREAQSQAGRRRAAGIYGAIITTSILTSVADKLPTLGLALSVLITLVVYWLAEQYAEVLGQQTERGQLPSMAHIRHALRESWPIVSASFAPLAVLILARLAGASRADAAWAGIGASILLLTYHGWSAGRAADLRGGRLAATTVTAAVLGLVLVALKNLVISHLH
jgi:hypothetical protein